MELAAAARYARLSSIKRSTAYRAKLRVSAFCSHSGPIMPERQYLSGADLRLGFFPFLLPAAGVTLPAFGGCRQTSSSVPDHKNALRWQIRER